VAASFTGADPEACVLLCAVELCSLHLQYGWEAERIVANALFADGAAALVASGEGPEATVESAPGLRRWIASGSFLVPGSAEAMSWAIEDHGFVMGLSPRVPDLIGAHLRPWLEAWLAAHQLTLESIGCWAVHPGGPRILAAVTETLGLDPALIEPSRSVLRDCGNMSSPTILFVLQRVLASTAAADVFFSCCRYLRRRARLPACQAPRPRQLLCPRGSWECAVRTARPGPACPRRKRKPDVPDAEASSDAHGRDAAPPQRMGPLCLRVPGPAPRAARPGPAGGPRSASPVFGSIAAGRRSCTWWVAIPCPSSGRA
jgi:hypothetical protein